MKKEYAVIASNMGAEAESLGKKLNEGFSIEEIIETMGSTLIILSKKK